MCVYARAIFNLSSAKVGPLVWCRGGVSKAVTTKPRLALSAQGSLPSVLCTKLAHIRIEKAAVYTHT